MYHPHQLPVLHPVPTESQAKPFPATHTTMTTPSTLVVEGKYLELALSQPASHGDILTYHGKGKLGWTPTQMLVEAATQVAQHAVSDMIDRAFSERGSPATATATATKESKERLPIMVKEHHDIPSSHTSRLMQILANSAQNSIQSSGFGMPPQMLAPATSPPANMDSLDGPFVQFRNLSSILPAAAGFVSPVFNTVKVGWNPEFSCFIRVPGSMAQSGRMRYWLGFTNEDLKSTTMDSLKAQKVMAFYLDTSVGAWFCVTNVATPTVPIQKTKGHAVISGSSVFELYIRINAAAGSVDYYINRKHVAHHDKIPDAGSSFGYVVQSTRTGTHGCTTLDFSRMAITHS